VTIGFRRTSEAPKYLVANEYRIHCARRHWVAAVFPALRALIVATAASFLLTDYGGGLVEQVTSRGFLIRIALLIAGIVWVRKAIAASGTNSVRLPGFLVSLGIGVLAWQLILARTSPGARLVWIWLLWFLAASFGAVEYFMTEIVLTDRRILVLSGVFTRLRSTLPYRAVTDMSYEKTVLGDTFGYGHMRVETAGQIQAVEKLRFIENPEDVYHVIMRYALGTVEAAPPLPPRHLEHPPPGCW
jgi:hypothetical protein